MKPQIQIKPKYYIVPLLHLMIGIVNKIWFSMIYFFDKFVENMSKKEASLKDLVRDIVKEIDDLNEEIEINTVNKNMACSSKTFDSKAHEIYNTKRKKELNKDLRKAKLDLDGEQKK